MSARERQRCKVFLVGTHHTYQYGAASTYAQGCTQEEEALFRQLITDAAVTYAVRGVAEELNEDCLAENDVSQSVLQQEAASLGLPHCFCEAGSVERTASGVEQESDIRASAWMNGWSEEEVQRRLRGEFRKRETVWFDRLAVFDTWPVLFVCGANHIGSFTALLVELGIEVEVLASCWEVER